MAIDFKSIFNNLGYSEEYGLVYGALVKHGRLRMANLAKKAGLPRTSCYEYIPKLLEFGIVSEVQVGKSKYYEAEPPSVLVEKIYSRKNTINYLINDIEVQFDELKRMYSQNNVTRSVNTLEGEREILDYFSKINQIETLKIIYFEDSLTKLSTKIRKFIENILDEYDGIKLNSSKGDRIIKFIFSDKVLSVDFENMVMHVINDKKIADFELKVFDNLKLFNE